MQERTENRGRLALQARRRFLDHSRAAERAAAGGVYLVAASRKGVEIFILQEGWGSTPLSKNVRRFTLQL